MKTLVIKQNKEGFAEVVAQSDNTGKFKEPFTVEAGVVYWFGFLPSLVPPPIDEKRYERRTLT